MDYSADVVDRTSDLTISADWSEAFARVSAPPLAPVEQVIDLDHLARMTLGEAKLGREVLQLFDQQVEMLLEHITSEAPKVIARVRTHTGRLGAWDRRLESCCGGRNGRATCSRARSNYPYRGHEPALFRCRRNTGGNCGTAARTCEGSGEVTYRLAGLSTQRAISR